MSATGSGGPDDARALVQRASRGDPVAIGALLEAHRPRLEVFLRLRMGAELRAFESGADLVQSVCREILENLERYRYQGEAEFRRWLYTTALRKVKNRVRYLRAERRDAGRVQRAHGPAGLSQSTDALARLVDSIGTPSQDAVAREELEALERAFASLPEHYREVITLARVVGLPHAEIARALGKTEEATRALLFRALAALSKQLQAPAG